MKLCCVFNLAPHYREAIFRRLDQELNCDFYFGDQVGGKIKAMDHNSLKGFKGILHNRNLFKKGYVWQDNVWKLAFKNYSHFLVTGSPYIISTYILAILCRMRGKKIYAWSHGMKGNSGKKKRLLELIFFKLMHRVFLYGDYSRQVMIKEGFEKTNLIPIYNSLSYTDQLKVRSRLNSSDIYTEYFKNNFPVLIYIGRIQKVKKLDQLIDAIGILKGDGIDVNLVVIGKDVEDLKLENLVNQLGLEDRVWFYGPCYSEVTIGELIFNADLCVSPGPVGLTALHSLTYGTPVLTNDDFSRQMPEFESIEPGKTGDFFEVDNTFDLSEKIRAWINLSRERRNEVRNYAYRRIDEKFNPDYQIKVLKQNIGSL